MRHDGDSGGVARRRVMTSIPDWETAPIAEICAPPSALLITRIMPWYTMEIVTRAPGLQAVRSASDRLRMQEKVRNSRNRRRAGLIRG